MPINIPVVSKPRIVIVGGGFAGLELAKGLKKAEAQIVLIDKNNYHTFQPLLYQVATAALEADSVGYPFREIFKKQDNVIFRMAEVLRVKPEENAIETSIGNISYDYLVLATGTKTNYFGMADMQNNAMPMKSISQAMALRTMILENFEKALLTTEIQEQERLMNILVVGGGPTGVETAGALGELRRVVLPHDYPELDFHRMQIHIVDVEDRLLKTMSPQASESAEKFLSKFDVNIWLKTKVTAFDGKMVSLSNGKKIMTDTVIWSAGVMGSVLPGLKPEAVDHSRLLVDEYSRVSDYKNIFAMGDVAGMITPKTPKGHPMVAQVAIQQAKALSRNLNAILQEKKLKPFRYVDIGVMATIGRNNAVADFPWFKIQGPLGWFLWVIVHLMALVGFRNKLVALVNWTWNYFSYDRGLRLIIRAFDREKNTTPKS